MLFALLIPAVLAATLPAARFTNGTTSATGSATVLPESTSHAPTGAPLASLAPSSTTTTTTTTTVVGPQLTLIPAVHFSVDVHAIINLVPSYSADVHFSGSGTSSVFQANYVADVSVSLIYPAVNLDNSALVQSKYDGTSISLVFASSVSFAKGASWLPGTVYIFYQSGFGDGGHVYFLSVNIVCDSRTLSCTITGSDVGLQGAASDLNISWGKYLPSSPFGNGNGATGNTGNGVTSNPTYPVVIRNGTSNTTLPTCSFGDTFDKCLDDQIGYLNFDEADFSSSYDNFAPGVAGTGDNEAEFDLTTQNPPDRRRSNLEKRFSWNPIKFFKKVAATVVQVVTAPARIVYQAAVKVAQQIPILKDIVNREFSQSLNTGFDVQIPKAGSVKTVASSFSQTSYPIFSSGNGDLNVYCVDCGVSGRVNLAGQAAVSIANGLTQANVGVNGNILAVLQIGVDAQAKFTKKFQKDLFEVGIPGLTIPKIITVGPSIKVGTSLELSLNARGSLLVGAKVGFPAFKATLDFIDGSRSGQSGFSPQLERVFNASGEISAEADFGIPIGLNIGINILSGTFQRQIALVEQPGVHAEAKLAFSTSLQGGTTVGDGTCPGITYGISFTNKVFVAIPSRNNIDLFSTAIPALNGCYTLSSSAAQSSTSSASSSGSTSASESTTATSDPDAEPTSETTSATSEPTAGPTTSAEPTESNDTTEPTAEPTTEPTTSATSTSDPAGPTGVQKRQDASSSDDNVPTNQDAELGDPNANASESDIGDVGEGSSSGDAAYTVENPLDDPVPEDTQAQEDGITYASIINTENNIQIILADDDNLYLDPISTDAADPGGNAFMVLDGFIAGAVNGEVFHYYRDSMDTYGVSRFRASYVSEIPKTGDALFLKPIGDGDDSIVAVDTQGNVFFIMTCQIPSRGTMTFLAKDPDAGAITLQSAEVQNTITGGLVSECFLAPLVMQATSI